MLQNNIQITVDRAGVRLDVFLAETLSDFTRSRIKKHLESDMIMLNSKAIKKAGVILKQGDLIEIALENVEEINATAEDLPLEIIYEDATLAVINKAQGMVTHPAPGAQNGTLVNALLHHISDLSTINGVVRPGIVHRLDKNTSGLIVIAKDDNSHKSLSSQIAAKTATRIYTALVDGNIKVDSGTITSPIARSKTDRKKMAVVAEGRHAITHYTIMERFGEYTLVEFKLGTGRTHQIRVHSKHINHPVVGDSTYGGSNKFGLSGQLLHASRLEFTHPKTGELMRFESNLPVYFDAVLTKLRAKLR
ncbi:MAG: RluA family pseudouridine synthase [Christensenellaceae bacterium]|jgi:23S rRNA pseudouridine1911/1915/1917 synthase|nr:RluA family pseudouridine synthase [Christensenellaceae bacterium]